VQPLRQRRQMDLVHIYVLLSSRRVLRTNGHGANKRSGLPTVRPAAAMMNNGTGTPINGRKREELEPDRTTSPSMLGSRVA